MRCSAPYCPNHSSEGFQMYRFPANLESRKKWLMNSKHANWEPAQNARLCSVHFEDYQFERRHAGGKRKLLPFAIPTLFNVSKPLKVNEHFKSLDEARVSEPLPSATTSVTSDNFTSQDDSKRVEDPVARLNKKVVELEEKLKQQNQQCEDSAKMYERIVELEEKLRQQSQITRDLHNKYVQLEEHFTVQTQALLFEWS